MMAKEYLSQAYKIDNDINSKLEQVLLFVTWQREQQVPCQICPEAQTEISIRWRMPL